MMDRFRHLLGDTIRITFSFYNFDESIIVPESSKIVVYDSNWKVIDTFQLDSENLLEDGHTFYYDYTLTRLGVIYIETFGMIAAMPSLERFSIEVKQI